MTSMMAMPREGHQEQIFHMFSYLRIKLNSTMLFELTAPDIEDSQFVCEDWSSSSYSEYKEELPPDASQPKGTGFTMRTFVDYDNAGKLTTRRSQTGFIIFLNSSPIYWFPKRKTSVETSSFGSEFIAMKQSCEYVRGMHYKYLALREIGRAK